MKVSEWLSRLSLGQYGEAFERNDIDLEVLPSLTEQDLEQLGLSMGHRKKLLKAIGEMHSALALVQTAKALASPASPDVRAIESTTAEGERRQVTVLFCDLVGSTGLSNALDPEVYRGLLSRYHETAIRGIQRYEGYVAQIQGDGIVAYFGYPLAHEGEADRALRAALEVIEGLRAAGAVAGEPLQVRIGIACGLVVVSHILAPDKSAVGETPNLAHRLQALAQPGEVLVSERARALAGGGFDYEDRGLHALKGIAGQTRAWRVRGVSGAASRFEAATRGRLTPMVGREQEVGLLLDRWNLARAGEGQVVLLQGEPGIGKSRMLRAFRERVGPALELGLQYQCSPYYTNSAFYPIVDHLERALGFSREDSAQAKLDKLEGYLIGQYGRGRTECNLLARALAVPCEERYGALEMSPQRQKEDTIALLVDLVAEVSRQRATVVLFEDVHWADPTSVEVLGALIDRTPGLPLLVLLTYRPEFEPPWLSRAQVSPIALTRLSRAQGASIVLRVAQDKPLPGELVTQIVDKTDGVPLFLEELTKAVLESDMLIDAGDRYEYSGKVERLAIPNTLRDSLMARLDRLIPVKEIAQIGAVLGREFSYELVAAVSPMSSSQLEEALDKLTASELVFRRGSVPNAIYTFKHALVQDAAYDSLLKSKRQGLHAQIARAIEQRLPDKVGSEPELLAHHYTEAGLLEAAIPYWRKAGELAQQRVALQEAISYFERALSLAQELAPSTERDSCELQLRGLLGMAWLALQGWAHPAVAEHLQHAYTLEGVLTPGWHSLRVLWGLWVYQLAIGRPRMSLPMARELLSQARAGDDDQMLHAGLWALTTTHYWLAEYERSIESADAILVRYDAARHRALADALNHDPKTVALQYKASSTHTLGHPDQAAALMEETLEHSRARDHAFDHVWALYFAIAQLHALRRDATGIERLLPEFERRARSQRLLFFEQIIGPFCRALAERHAGDPAAGGRRMAALLAGLQAARVTPIVADAKIHCAECALAMRQPREALALVDEVFAQISQPGCELGYLHPELLRIKGLCQYQRGERDGAELSLRGALELARAQKAKWWELRAATHYARLLGQESRRDEARALLQPVYDWFTEGHDTRDLQDAAALLRDLQ